MNRCIKAILALIITAIYVVLGAHFEDSGIIVQPHNWSMFGAVFGITLSAIIGWPKC